MADEKKDLIFVDGFRVFKPRDTAPKTIKANVIITLAELKEFIKNNNIKEQIRIDIRKSEAKGTLYATLNTWKPTKDAKEISEEDIPF